MQQNIVIGNIARINKIEGTQKVFLTVADHYMTKGQDGKMVQKTNYVPVEGFLPESLTLTVGQLVAVNFRVQSFQTKDGTYKTANDIISIDVTLRSKGKGDKADKAEDAPAAAAEADPVPAAPEM